MLNWIKQIAGMIEKKSDYHYFSQSFSHQKYSRFYSGYYQRYSWCDRNRIMKSLRKDYLKNVGKYLHFYLTVKTRSQPIKSTPCIFLECYSFCKSLVKEFEMFCKYLLLFNPVLNCNNDKSYYKLIPF